MLSDEESDWENRVQEIRAVRAIRDGIIIFAKEGIIGSYKGDRRIQFRILPLVMAPSLKAMIGEFRCGLESVELRKGFIKAGLTVV